MQALYSTLLRTQLCVKSRNIPQTLRITAQVPPKKRHHVLTWFGMSAADMVDDLQFRRWALSTLQSEVGYVMGLNALVLF
eukprot:40129-Amphidinium_carterae.1